MLQTVVYQLATFTWLWYIVFSKAVSLYDVAVIGLHCEL